MVAGQVAVSHRGAVRPRTRSCSRKLHVQSLSTELLPLLRREMRCRAQHQRVWRLDLHHCKTRPCRVGREVRLRHQLVTRHQHPLLLRGRTCPAPRTCSAPYPTSTDPRTYQPIRSTHLQTRSQEAHAYSGSDRSALRRSWVHAQSGRVRCRPRPDTVRGTKRTGSELADPAQGTGGRRSSS
jgi:hypothetical protein